MLIISHRGVWRDKSEQNTLPAFQRSLEGGFGVETDIRHHAGGLVISHDVPLPGALSVSQLFGDWSANRCQLPLALNIKEDGLHTLLQTELEQCPSLQYFCFDMSVPETLQYARRGLRFFSRWSECEREPVLYDQCAGLWLDMFTSDWVQPEALVRHLECEKELCVVSPELHGRPHDSFWHRLAESGVSQYSKLMLCTDLPREAEVFFHGKD
jgi:hypothetical protein